jgi:hypothetical protein
MHPDKGSPGASIQRSLALKDTYPFRGVIENWQSDYGREMTECSTNEFIRLFPEPESLFPFKQLTGQCLSGKLYKGL